MRKTYISTTYTLYGETFVYYKYDDGRTTFKNGTLFAESDGISAINEWAEQFKYVKYSWYDIDVKYYKYTDRCTSYDDKTLYCEDCSASECAAIVIV